MGSIRKKGDRYHAQIRKKNHPSMSATFDLESDALLWVKYKERLIDNMAAFDVPKRDLMTVRDALTLKYQSIEKEKQTAQLTSDYKFLERVEFAEWMDKPLSYVTYDIALEKAKLMLTQQVGIGGSKGTKGRMVLQSPTTVTRKFRILGAAFSYIISLGIDVENIFPRVTKIIRNKIKDECGEDEED